MSNDRAGDGPPRVSYVIGRLDRALRRELDHRLAEFELSWPEYTAMSILCRTSGLSNAQLARRSYVAPQTMLEVIARLEQAGYIERRPSPSHRRILETRLTERGLAGAEDPISLGDRHSLVVGDKAALEIKTRDRKVSVGIAFHSRRVRCHDCRSPSR